MVTVTMIPTAGTGAQYSTARGALATLDGDPDMGQNGRHQLWSIHMDSPDIFRFNNSQKTIMEIEREIYMNGGDLGEIFARLEDVSADNLELQDAIENNFTQSDVDDAFDDTEHGVLSKIDNFQDDAEGIIDAHLRVIDEDDDLHFLLMEIKNQLRTEIEQLRVKVEREINYARL